MRHASCSDGTNVDRVRAGIANSGFSIPTGQIEVELSLPKDGPREEIDLAIALVIMLADPAHRTIRRNAVVASGMMRLDGTLFGNGTPLIGDLPDGPWVGRFWHPSDRVPTVDEDAVVSIVDVKILTEAWEALLKLVEMERALDAGPLSRTPS